MKERPNGFLSEYFNEPSKDEEVASYIQELHEYLWRFVISEFPFANGELEKYLDVALEHSLNRTKQPNDG
jgi:hypothetical protein